MAQKGKILEIKSFSEIVEEEAIKSIFNIPYLLLFPFVILKKVFYTLDLILIKIYQILVNSFLDNSYADYITKNSIEIDIDGLILDNIILCFLTLYINILILYIIFLIPQFILKYILYNFSVILYKIDSLIIDFFNFSHIYEREEIIDENYTNNLILGNIIKIFIIIFQIIIILYDIFLIPQLLLNHILYFLNNVLFKVNNLLSFSPIYERSLIDEKYSNNLILENLTKIFIIYYQISNILYGIFLILQIFLKFIIYYFNIIPFKIHHFTVEIFKFSHLYERDLIDKTLFDNLIFENIVKIFIFIFQVIIILIDVFRISPFFLMYIFYFLNVTLFKAYNLLVKTFLVYRFENNYLDIIYDDKNIPLFLVNIYGITFLLFQLILICLTILITPEIIIIRLLSLNYITKNYDSPLNERIGNCSFIMFILQLIYGFIFLCIKYVINILPSIYYILFDLNLKSRNTVYDTIKDLSNIIYNSNYYDFTQIFLGKYYLNILLYFWNRFANKYVIFHLSKTTDIIFVKILENIFTEFNKIPFVPIYFPLKYLLMLFGIAFKCIYIKLNGTSFKIYDLLLNAISLFIGFGPLYLMYACFENDSKRIIFTEIPLFIYIVFNIWICGKALNKLNNLF